MISNFHFVDKFLWQQQQNQFLLIMNPEDERVQQRNHFFLPLPFNSSNNAPRTAEDETRARLSTSDSLEEPLPINYHLDKDPLPLTTFSASALHTKLFSTDEDMDDKKVGEVTTASPLKTVQSSMYDPELLEPRPMAPALGDLSLLSRSPSPGTSVSLQRSTGLSAGLPLLEEGTERHYDDIFDDDRKVDSQSLSSPPSWLFSHPPAEEPAALPSETTSTIDKPQQMPNPTSKDKNRYVHRDDTLLPVSFTPGPRTVIIGRRNDAKQTPGNQHLRKVASHFLNEYANASTKPVKSKIVSSVVAAFEEQHREIGDDKSSDHGPPFVRLGPDGRWYQVRDSVAREKVGYTMRELLGERYRSSSTAKKVARRSSSLGSTTSNTSSEI